MGIPETCDGEFVHQGGDSIRLVVKKMYTNQRTCFTGRHLANVSTLATCSKYLLKMLDHDRGGAPKKPETPLEMTDFED